MQLSGARHQCSLFVDRVTRHMHGDWMCLLNEISQFNSGLQIQSRVVLQMKAIRRFVITEKAPTRAFSWLKAATTAFTFKTLLKHKTLCQTGVNPTVSRREIGLPTQKS